MTAKVQLRLTGECDEVRVGRFVLEDEIGEGGFSKVYKAVDPKLQRTVALKVYKKSIVGADQPAALLKEARALATIAHPNVVSVYEADQHEGRVFLAMELVQGKTLKELVEGGLRWTEALELYVAAGRGLAAAHGRKLVHGDFKPANVIVDDEGRDRKRRPRVLDFGLAHRQTGAALGDTAQVEVEDLGAIDRGEDDTKSKVWGTPQYMALEQFRGRPTTPKSDQFSFCVALYEAVYGLRPFPGENVAQVIMALEDNALQRPPPAALRDRPKRLLSLLSRGLAVDPAERHPSMETLLDELEALLERRQVPRRNFIAAGATGLLFLGLALGTRALDRQRCIRDASDLRAQWGRLSSDLPETGLLDAVNLQVDQLASAWGATCDEGSSNLARSCRTMSQREFDRFASLVEQVGLPPTGETGLVEGFASCLEEQPAADVCRDAPFGSKTAQLIGTAQTQLVFGLPGDALANAEFARQRARDEGTQLAEIQSLLVLGRAQTRVGDPSAGRKSLEDAFVLATACDADLLAVDAAIHRAEVEIRSSVGLASQARFPLRLAQTLLDKPEMSGFELRRARLLEKRADVGLYLEASCDDEVRSDFEEVLEIRANAVANQEVRGHDASHALVALADAELNLTNFLSECTDELGPEAALQRYDAIRRRLTEEAGVRSHPSLATLEFNVGRAHARAGQYGDAEKHYRAALAMRRVFAGANAGKVADVHYALAALLLEQERYEDARPHVEQSAAIRELPGNSNPVRLAESHDALGLLSQQDGDMEAALQHHRDGIAGLRAAEAARPLNGHEANSLAALHLHEAVDLCVLERKGEASAALQRAHDVRGDRSPVVEAQIDDLTPDLAGEGCGLMAPG